MLDFPSYKRLFIAFEAPETWTSAATDCLNLLKSHVQATGSFRWLRSEFLHLTLCFLGNIDGKRLPEIEKTVQESIPLFHGSDIDFSQWIWLPLRTRPNVLAAAFSAPELEVPVQSLRNKLKPYVKTEPFSRFLPHVTVARISGKATPFSVNSEGTPPFPVRTLALYESHLSPSGSSYVVLNRWTLST